MNKLKEALKYYRTFYSWNDIEVKIIVSTGRTGTNFLANFFSENYSKIFSVHEPAPDLFKLSMKKFRGNNSIYNLKKEIKISRYKQYKDVTKQGFNIYLESNPNLSFILPELIEIFKNPKVVFVTRDIQSYIISAYNKSPDNSNISFFYAENDHRKRITPFDVNDEESSSNWTNWDRLIKIAWYWNYCNKYILNSLESYPFYQVKFEDLFGKDKVSEIEKLVTYLGLDRGLEIQKKEKKLSERKNKNSISLLNDYEAIPNEIKKEIELLTDKTRKLLGYN